MLPQILATIWLTLMWSAIVAQLKNNNYDTPDAIACASVIIGIFASILCYGNFWCVS